jgi:antitoxin component of MazEF toxin-antitoxin module
MELRKLMRMGSSHVVAIPRDFQELLGISPGEYLEMFLADHETLVLRKHKLTERRRANNGTR